MYAKSVFKYQVYLYGSEAFYYLLTNLVDMSIRYEGDSHKCLSVQIVEYCQFISQVTRETLAKDFPTESVFFSRWVFVLWMRLQLVNVLPLLHI